MSVFTYPAQLVRVVDGDTLRLIVDVGFNMTRRESSYRLGRIDAPEMSTEAGKETKARLDSFLYGKSITCQTFKADSFGRYIAEVWTSDGTNLSDWLVANKLAVYKEY